MSAPNVLAYKRTLRTYLALGVTLADAAEVVRSLKGGTDLDELALALNDYVPAGAFDDDRPTRGLAAA